MSARPLRGSILVEWAAFGIAALVVLGVLAAIASMWGTARPGELARIVVDVTGVEPVGDAYAATVNVRNVGTGTAAAVQVVAELEVDPQPMEGEQVIDILPGGGEHTVVFVFPSDPRQGRLDVRIASYQDP
ncbi:MAG TPA: hypothetical protein VML96_01000 [Egibacteraceae bacterium]|nr:hypothetical protein [Egibacteraceae bacterium]